MSVNWEQLSLILGDDATPADEEMKDLFRLFVDDAGRRLRTLNAPERPLDRPSIAKEAHKVRGAAASFGFDHLAMVLRTIETQIGDLQQVRLDELLREGLQSFEQSVREVHERYPGLAA